jgi:2,4-dienoyl-CoA reductase-like NADH-dependent reductase (Old Yellow Enzyme family)
MTTYSSHDDGRIRESELEYLERRACSGYGMVMTAACYVHGSGHAFPGQWSCSGDEDHDSLSAAAAAIHRGGAAAVLQIHHGGRQAPARLCGPERAQALDFYGPVSASAIPSEREGAEIPRALEEPEIAALIEAYAQAAVRARRAGYDGVEIHGANTYLLQQFVSPHSNRREDAWGEDRLRFPLAVTDAVLAAVGPRFAVGYRFSPEETETPGIRIADTLALVEALSSRPLSWLHLSLRRWDQSSLVGDFREPVFDLVARQVSGRIPLITVGGVQRSQDAEAALTMGADLVAIGRAAITEPEWPQIALAGGDPQLVFPADGAEESLTLPEGLVRRILEAPGWFEIGSAKGESASAT